MLLIEIFTGDTPDDKTKEFVNLPDPKKQRKRGKKKSPTTDSKENSIISNLWRQSNADAV